MFDINKGFKLKKLYIKDFKIFKDFKIDFTSKEDEPLPIIVIAGINGCGKTTLFEYIYENHFLSIGAFYEDNNNYIEVIQNNTIKTLNNTAKKKKKEIDDYLKKESKKNDLAGIAYDENGLFLDDLHKYIVYIKAMDNDVIDIKQNILEHYRKKSRELDSHSKALKEIQDFIQSIFGDLDLKFNICDINDVVRDKEKVDFKNSDNDIFSIESLSTGEKTLLSKVLNLYFQGIKNKVILIDEPELSLHPSWQNKILKLYEKFANDNNCQIIIATHSPHIIASAKNEYIRILRVNDENNIEVIDDVLAYGRDLEWVLEEVMGTQYTREKNILKKFEECQTLINNNNFDEAEKQIDILESIIGEQDNDILKLRNDLSFERMEF